MVQFEKRMLFGGSMKNRTFASLYAVSIIIVVVILFLALAFPGKDLQISFEEPIGFNENWHMVSTDLDSSKSVKQIPSLPIKLDIPVQHSVSIEKNLNSDFDDPQTLLIRGSLQHLSVFLDNRPVYSRIYEQTGVPVLPMASSWNLVEIPRNSAGEVLRITTSSPFQVMSGQINAIQYGSKSQLMLYLIREFFLVFILTGIILLLGIILTILPLAFRKMAFSTIGAVGLFSIFVSFYLFSEGRLIQFFTGNQFVIGSLGYVTQSIYPIPLLFYAKEMLHEKYHRGYHFLIGAFIANLVVILALQLLGIHAFFNMLWITHMLLLVSVVFIVYSLIKEIKRYKNGEAKRLLLSLSILFFFGILELLHFYFVDQVHVSFFILIGILLFVFRLIVDSLIQLNSLFKKSLQADLHEKMAHTDQLTKAPNRMAFDRDLKALIRQNKEPTTVGIFDLNNLKQINDYYGHKYGDEAIIQVYETLCEVFSKHGTCYRIGGDEFACI
ncbi:MAG TPA: hypothetical protein DHN33_04520, partial [Eubacteriaceae bacterium]|nr:hypothetical protein [Eubacteriaceae bacterium]